MIFDIEIFESLPFKSIFFILKSVSVPGVYSVICQINPEPLPGDKDIYQINVKQKIFNEICNTILLLSLRHVFPVVEVCKVASFQVNFRKSKGASIIEFQLSVKKIQS